MMTTSELSLGTRASLLVATPQLDGSIFARTVILICEYNEEGAMGLVVNRNLELSQEAVMSQLEIPVEGSGFERAVLWGGPVEPSSGLVVTRRPADWKPQVGSVAIGGTELFLSGSRLLLESIAAGTWIEAWNLCLGYAGWGVGQLDQEIAEGSWILTAYDDELVLDAPLETRWERAIASLGVQGMMFGPPADA